MAIKTFPIAQLIVEEVKEIEGLLELCGFDSVNERTDRVAGRDCS
jgi:hypothetical protein